MKSVCKFSALIAVAVIFSFALTGCAKKDDPKTLAKETYDLTKEMISAADDDSKMKKLSKKASKINAKVEMFSSADKITYHMELARLMASDASNYIQDLTGAASSLLKSEDVADMINSFSSLLGNSQEAIQNTLNEFNEVFNSAEVQDALNELKSYFEPSGQ